MEVVARFVRLKTGVKNADEKLFTNCIIKGRTILTFHLIVKMNRAETAVKMLNQNGIAQL